MANFACQGCGNDLRKRSSRTKLVPWYRLTLSGHRHDQYRCNGCGAGLQKIEWGWAPVWRAAALLVYILGGSFYSVHFAAPALKAYYLSGFALLGLALGILPPVIEYYFSERRLYVSCTI